MTGWIGGGASARTRRVIAITRCATNFDVEQAMLTSFAANSPAVYRASTPPAANP